jgi:hypothetical protein
MSKNYYTLGPKATIAVVPKFSFKLFQREVIQLEDGKMLKNRTFSNLVSGGQLKKLSEVEAQDLIENKGFKDVTEGRKKVEAPKTEVTEEGAGKNGQPEKTEPPKPETIADFISKSDKTQILKWMEDADDTHVSLEIFETAGKIGKIADLRKYLQNNLNSEFLASPLVEEGQE